jgi:hypothetical protein
LYFYPLQLVLYKLDEQNALQRAIVRPVVEAAWG